MALTNSWPGVDGQATTTDARKNLAGLIARNAAGVVRAGVFPSSTAALVTGRADMNVDIAAHNAVAVQFGGPILLANDGVAQLPAVLVSPVSGTNYYVIYEKQNESTSPGTDASNTKVFGNVLSTTSFAAARATLPPGALELATVQIPSSVATTNAIGVTITQTHLFTSVADGTVLVRNDTELQDWTPRTGYTAERLDNGLRYRRVGTTWVPAVDGGLIVPTSITPSGGSASVDASGLVTFTGVGSVLLNGVFSTLFSEYEVLLNIRAMSGSPGNSPGFRFAAGGTVDSGSNYDYSLSTTSSGSLVTGVATSSYFPVENFASAVRGLYRLTLADPANSGFRTQWTGDGNGATATVGFKSIFSGQHDSVAAYDGLQMMASGGSFTGTLRVRGKL